MEASPEIGLSRKHSQPPKYVAEGGSTTSACMSKVRKLSSSLTPYLGKALDYSVLESSLSCPTAASDCVAKVRKMSSSLMPYLGKVPEFQTLHHHLSDEKEEKRMPCLRLPKVSCLSSCLSLQTGFVKQGLAVAGMSFGCVLDGTVIAYSSPALPSLWKDSSNIQINIHHASWIGNL